MEKLLKKQLEIYEDYFKGTMHKIYILNYTLTFRIKFNIFTPDYLKNLNSKITFFNDPIEKIANNGFKGKTWN